MAPTKVSATKAKLHFGSLMVKVKSGTPVIVEKNESPEMVWISIDDYEDFLELKDSKFQKELSTSKAKMKKGKHGGMDDLYALHRKTIANEAK